MDSLLCRPLAEGTGASLIYSTAPKNRQGTVSWVQREYTHIHTNIHTQAGMHTYSTYAHTFSQMYDDEIIHFGSKP